jgi:alpha-glucan,water dikinase
MSYEEKITMENGHDILIETRAGDDMVEVVIRMEGGKACVLHWGLRLNVRAPWQMPPAEIWPEGSRAYDHAALQTPFASKDGHGLVTVRIPRSLNFSSLDFVLFFPEEGRWENNRGRNYSIRIPAIKGGEAPTLGSRELDGLAEEIIGDEMSGSSWTLMHRFNLCYDLLDRARDIEGMALLFVWLRFSFLRQLDWQRNYNTKPRELGHAMDRLTLKIAGRYAADPENREMIRLLMSTLGKGSDAQRVRDEVLNIMHRRHIKEVSGHFMEEWHQKLHNNTTPDDVVICEAYLEFLRSNGNIERFYKKLNEGGVTRERLESYERPIKSPPDFIPSLKDALIGDFEHFLGILMGVHTGTDLSTAIAASRHLLDTELHGIMDFILSHRDGRRTPLPVLIGKITDGRAHLSRQLTGHPERVRDLLFLDMALEAFMRVAIERSLGPNISGNDLCDIIGMVLENLVLSSAGEDMSHCLKLWNRLGKMPRFGREWSLRARAVLDLAGHAIGTVIDLYHGLLQPKAEFLGKAFHAETWAVTLFSEEIMRGTPVFALSLLLRYLDPILRKSVTLGDWQVISRAEGAGRVKVVKTLQSIQGEDFAHPVVVIADSVSGNEEIAAGVVALLTGAAVDILSHLAVRARNAGLLFATCYDSGIIDKMKTLDGSFLALSVDPAGNVAYKETAAEINTSPPTVVSRTPLSRPAFTAYALSLDEFEETRVGGKAYTIKRMAGRLPDWVDLPSSAALPFGVFERVLTHEANKNIAERCGALLKKAEENKKESGGPLAEMRRTLLDLVAPPELFASLGGAMERSGLAARQEWDGAWMCIKEVWASKWNDRAYLSRITHGIAHEDLMMAVLIQGVVEAEYSFVIHTVNPITGSQDEVYGEAVLGLGEALAGNYPGKALSFVCKKGSREPQLLSFPGKSSRLFGGGLIFRSDSNGEDLEEFAGAGLYDSFILPPPRKSPADYTEDALFWDDHFRKDFLIHLAEIGEAIEAVLGGPQDIEGAYCRGRYYAVQSRPQAGVAKV